MKSKVLISLLVVLLLFSFSTISAQAQQEAAAKKPLIGYITNGPYEFWTYSAAAIPTMEEELGVDVELFLPPNGLPEEQKRFIESLVARGAAGIGISVVDPDNVTEFFNEVIASGIPMVMFDSDAPASNRLAYVGMSNYAAGRMAGELVKEVLPDGGEWMISVGRLDAQNAIERRQGMIDELNGEPYSTTYPGKMTPNTPNVKLGGGKWTLLETRTDGGDQSKTKAIAEDAILKFPEMDLIVGMWSYSSPAVISAVRDAGLLGKMKIIGFDMETELLQAVQDGYAYAALGQDPFTYAVKTIETLAKVIKGEDPKVPADGLIDVPALKITGENIDEVWGKYKEQLATGNRYIEATK
ncbi:MAG: substrate-binding domain-containing protein [Sphaerochaetaceae bacterium]|nr:substrate-binding domain-containing protein [Sphaerochaetaceae bacterium]